MSTAPAGMPGRYLLSNDAPEAMDRFTAFTTLFDPATFRHRAFYNRERSRIEMHLVSTADQRVRVGDATFAFLVGESIHTENSYKYDLTDFARRAAKCGLRADETWTDENDHFAVLYLTAVS